MSTVTLSQSLICLALSVAHLSRSFSRFSLSKSLISFGASQPYWQRRRRAAAASSGVKGSAPASEFWQTLRHGDVCIFHHQRTCVLWIL